MNTQEQDRFYSKIFHFVVDSGIWAKMLPTEKAVYNVLLRHIDGITRNCWPGNDIIAKEAGIHETNVGKATNGICNKWRLGKKWRKDRKNFYHLYTEKEFKDVCPRNMDISPSTKSRESFHRPRDKKGRFMPPYVIKEPSPQGMDNQAPSDMELVNPRIMGNKKNHTKEKQKEESMKNKQTPAGSVSACPQSQASPAFKTDVYRGHVIETQFELEILVEKYGESLLGLIRQGEIKLKEGIELDAALNTTKSYKSQMS